MSAADDVLIQAAESIAEGTAVDWNGVRQQPLDDHQSRVVTEMQVLERIAALLRDTVELPPAPQAKRRRQQPMPESWSYFTVLELIGDGGFGSVYRARDTKLQTDVALKLIDLPAGRAVRPSIDLKEARLLARVRHPNVVTVYGTDVVDGRVGIWMELILGRTLSSLLRVNGPLGAREAALIGVDLCRALAAVHAAGLVHGDIKTRNVMRESGGRTVLMDFGAGRDLSGLHLQGASDTVAGTPLYLAPEIFDGRALSRAADIYSLGVLLFHLATDAYPLRGQTLAEVEDAHRHGLRVRLRDIRPDLPDAFVAVVERALSRDPGERFQTAGELERALAQSFGQTPHPEPLPKRRWQWPMWAAAAVAAATVALATTFMERRLSRSEPPASASQAVVHAPAAAAPAGYQIDVALHRRRDGSDTRLRSGDRVAPGDELFMTLRVSAPTYVYVVNEDEAGESIVLFPLPGQAVANPVVGGTPVRIPGTRGEEVSWQITSVGGREHFIMFASPERLQAFEEMFAELPRPVAGKPVQRARIPEHLLPKLRSVGGLTVTPASKPRALLSSLFTLPLGDQEETAQGLWVRQLTVDNSAAR